MPTRFDSDTSLHCPDENSVSLLLVICPLFTGSFSALDHITQQTYLRIKAKSWTDNNLWRKSKWPAPNTFETFDRSYSFTFGLGLFWWIQTASERYQVMWRFNVACCQSCHIFCPFRHPWSIWHSLEFNWKGTETCLFKRASLFCSEVCMVALAHIQVKVIAQLHQSSF